MNAHVVITEEAGKEKTLSAYGNLKTLISNEGERYGLSYSNVWNVLKEKGVFVKYHKQVKLEIYKCAITRGTFEIKNKKR